MGVLNIRRVVLDETDATGQCETLLPTLLIGRRNMDEKPDLAAKSDTQTDTPTSVLEGGEAFAREAESSSPGFVVEFIDFLLHNKKWWLLPIVAVLLLFGLLMLLGGTGAAPFIYTLF